MIRLIRTNSGNPAFVELVHFLDTYLAEIDGKDHSFYAQFNTINNLKHVVVAYDNEEPVACGAMKILLPGTMEIKRMYTVPHWRNKQIASMILTELENWATELSCVKCVLETGKRQPDAIALYKRKGYHMIPNYGHYAGLENSVCFEKINLHSGFPA